MNELLPPRGSVYYAIKPAVVGVEEASTRRLGRKAKEIAGRNGEDTACSKEDLVSALAAAEYNKTFISAETVLLLSNMQIINDKIEVNNAEYARGLKQKTENLLSGFHHKSAQGPYSNEDHCGHETFKGGIYISGYLIPEVKTVKRLNHAGRGQSASSSLRTVDLAPYIFIPVKKCVKLGNS